MGNKQTKKEGKNQTKSPKIRIQVMIPLHILARINALIEKEKTPFNATLQNLIIIGLKVSETGLKFENKSKKEGKEE